MCLTCLNEEAGDHAFIGEKIDFGYRPTESDDEYDDSKKKQPWLYKRGKIVAMRAEKKKNMFEVEFEDEWDNVWEDEKTTIGLIKNYLKNIKKK